MNAIKRFFNFVLALMFELIINFILLVHIHCLLVYFLFKLWIQGNLRSAKYG